MPPKCSVRNQMFVFILTPNLNLHSGSGLKIWLNQTPNKMLGSCSNIVHNVRNRTTASLNSSDIFSGDLGEKSQESHVRSTGYHSEIPDNIHDPSAQHQRPPTAI